MISTVAHMGWFSPLLYCHSNFWWLLITKINTTWFVCLFALPTCLLFFLYSLLTCTPYSELWHTKRERWERERERGTFLNRAFFYDTLFIFISQKNSFFRLQFMITAFFRYQNCFVRHVCVLPVGFLQHNCFSLQVYLVLESVCLSVCLLWLRLSNWILLFWEPIKVLFVLANEHYFSSLLWKVYKQA